MDNREILMSLGLLTYEADVYEALVKLGSARVQELALAVSVPRPQIYVALGKLIEKGLATETRGKVTQYAAAAPGSAFQRTLKREEEALRAKHEFVRKLDRQFRRRATGEIPANFVLVLKGRQVKEFIDRQVAEAAREVLILVKSAQGQSAKSLEGAAQAETAMLKRGVRVRCLYEPAGLSDAAALPYVRRLARAGEKARVVESVPMNMMVFDDRNALFSLTTEQGELTVFAFTHPDLIRVMRNSFQYLWDQGEELRAALSRADRGAAPKTGE